MSGQGAKVIGIILCSAAVLGCSDAAGTGSPSTSSAQSFQTVTTSATSSIQSSSVVSQSGSPFASTRYGYQMVVPAGWTMVETSGSGGVHPDEPGVDTLRDGRGHTLSIVGEQAVPRLANWTCPIDRHLQGTEHDLVVEQTEQRSVAGIPARLSTYHLVIKPYVIHYLVVETVRDDGSGLAFSFESTTGQDDDDVAILSAILDGVSFVGT